jgi:hypothetical protein
MERRSNSRKNLYQSISMVIPSYNKRVVTATVLDIGLGGAFIETEVLLPENAALIIELKLPGKFVQNKFRLNARLVHRALRGVGVAFVGMPPGMINAFSQALSRHEQQPEPFKPDMVSGFVMQ